MKRLLSFFCAFLFLSNSYASNIDSLYQVIQATENDTTKSYLYAELIFDAINVDFKKVEEVYIQELKQHAEKTQLDEAWASFHDVSAEIQRSNGDFEAAIAHFQKAIFYYKKLGNKDLAVQLQMVMGYTNYQAGNYSAAIEQLQEAAIEADKLKYYGVKGGSLSNLGVVYRSQGKTDEAKATFEEALKTMRISACCPEYEVIASYNIATIIQDRRPKQGLDSLLSLEKIAKEKDFPYVGNYIINSIARGMIITGDLKKGLDYTYQAIDESKKQGNQEQLLIAYRNLGDCFAAIKDEEKTLEYYNKAEAIADSTSRYDELIFTRISLAEYYLNQDNPQKSAQILEAALLLAKKEKALLQESEIYPTLGKVYSKLGQNDKAAATYQKAIDLSIIDTHVIQAKAALAKLLFQEKKYQQAQNYAKEALAYAKKNEDQKILESASETLYLIAKKQGQATQALAYLEQNTTAKNNLLNAENIKGVTASELSYQFEGEKQEIALAQAQKELVYTANLNRQQTQRNALIAAVLGVGLLAFLIYRSYRSKQKSNIALGEKNQLITDQKEKLEELNYTKDRIFAIIGHDLRKPAIAFRGITKKINYLIKKQDFDRLLALGEGLEDNAFSLNALTDNLLNWALSQKDMVSYHPEKIQLQEIADELTPLFSRLAKDKNITLKTDIPKNLTVMADKNAMLTIIRNLIDNAVKFTPEGGQITFKAEEEGDRVMTKIIDTGVGMPQEKIKDLFTLKKGKTEQGTAGEKGTGLGLSLVKELVKINKGIIKVTSQIGKGTTFNVMLPAL